MYVPTDTLGSPKPTLLALAQEFSKSISTSKPRSPHFLLLTFFMCVLVALNLLPAAAQTMTSESRDGAKMRALNNSLLKIHGQMQQAGPSDAAVLRGQAVKVMSQRTAMLQKLIQTDAHAALTFAFPDQLLAELAWKFPEATEYLEKNTTVKGMVERWTIDYPKGKPAKTVLRMMNHNQPLELYLDGKEPGNLTSGSTLEVTGVVSGYFMAVSSTTVAPSTELTSSSTTSTNSCSTTGVQNTAVILATFPGVTLPSGLTNAGLNDTFFNSSTGPSVDGFLRDASYGQASATGSVFGPYTLTGSYTSCTDVGGAMLNDAIAAAAANGANLSNYSRVFLVFPEVFGCGWAGFASSSCTINSSSGTFNASLSYMAADYSVPRSGGVQVATHELGHNMNLLHSGTVTGGTTVLAPVGTGGTTTDSGDYWSTMGEAVLGLYPAPQKAEVLGWIPASNYQTVQSSGTYTIQPFESAASGLQALKIQRGTGNNEWLWVEYRQPIGNYDSTLGTQPFSGALIHFEDPTTLLGHSYLANFNPGVPNSPALSNGQSWTDPYSNLSIAVTGATASALTVTVNFGSGSTSTCAASNPTVTATPLDPSIAAGSTASYGLTVTNNDASGCASKTFTLASTQPSGWSTSFTAGTVTLGPGQSSSVTMTKTGPSGTAPGTYAVNASASNSTYSGSTTANVTVVSAPAISATLSVPSSTFNRKSSVPLTVTVMNGGKPVSGASVSFNLIKPDGTASTQTATTTSKGLASWNYKLTAKSLPGAYSASAQVTIPASGTAGTQSLNTNTANFSVQ